MLSKTDLVTVCPWKGDASYYTINLDSKCCVDQHENDTDQRAETELKNAAWYYPIPKEKALNIKDYVAFCKSHTSPRICCCPSAVFICVFFEVRCISDPWLIFWSLDKNLVDVKSE
jgi:hypothetical protein